VTFFFDCRFIRVEQHDGISRFSAELFSAVSNLVAVKAIISDPRQLAKLPKGVDHVMANDPTNPFQELFLPRRLNALGASVVFSPMQTMGSVGKRYRLVLTLHDLIYYKHRQPPAFLAWPIRLAWRLFHLGFGAVRLLLGRADAVVTISETTKNQMLRHRLTTNPIHVVYNASSMSHVPRPLAGPATRNLVYMGSFMPYKNVELLFSAIELLPEYTLTLLSGISARRKSQLLGSVSESTAARVRFVNGASESEYQHILDESFALVSASKDEGFGIPLIEAMSRAIPVVVSDIAIFREVAGSAGSYFENTKVEALVSEIRALEDLDRWTQASSNALVQSERYDWQNSASKLLEVVRGLTD
jgi:glycosyltransferase involved in cell wall biosynthesis